MNTFQILIFSTLSLLVSCQQNTRNPYADSIINDTENSENSENSEKSENSENSDFCYEHNKECVKFARELNMTLNDYHQWDQKLQNAIEMEDEMTDANGDIVDPNSISDNSSSTFDAWQCAYCGIVSRGTREPSGGDYGGTGGCHIHGNHRWDRVNTKVGGWQCRKCGTISHLEREPCCGEFGGARGCTNERSHSWSRY